MLDWNDMPIPQSGPLPERDIDRLTIEQYRGFSDLFRRRRRELGLSQMELAAKAGVSQTLISTLERGPHQGMRAIDLFKVCRAIDVRPDEIAALLGLFDAEDRPGEDERTRHLVRDLSRLDQDKRDFVLDTVAVILRGLRPE